MVFYSIGHSNHPTAHFLELLRLHEVRTLADVRSVPFSRHAPQFGRHVLERSLAEAGMEYVYLGQELGGRPEGAENYDAAGHVLYGRLATSEPFREGLERLTALANQRRIAVMCAEEDPGKCHRHLLVGRVLEERGAEVRHIRKDGSIVSSPGQLTLPEHEADWRSPRPVRRPHAVRGDLADHAVEPVGDKQKH